MKIFKDADGNEWKVSLDFDMVDEIAARVERPGSTPEERKYYDLMDMMNREMISALQIRDPNNSLGYLRENIRCIVNLLYVVCEAQCKERDVSPEQFAKLMVGQTLGDAYDALSEEIINFIPTLDDREAARAMITASDQNAKVVLKEMTQIFQENQAAVDARATSEIRKIGEGLKKNVEDALDAAKPTT